MSHIIHGSKFFTDRLNRIKQRGISPLTAIDIGANTGQWYNEFSEVFPNTNILSIEANPNNEKQLKLNNPNSLITLMGRENNSNVDFYISNNTDNDVGASIYREATQYGNDSYSISLPMITLDSLNKRFDWIKLDVQGAELDVLESGLDTLHNAIIVELELSIMKYNHGAPLASEIISWMWNNGFEMYDITELAYIEENNDGIRKLVQTNTLFLNNKYSHLLEIKG